MSKLEGRDAERRRFLRTVGLSLAAARWLVPGGSGALALLRSRRAEAQACAPPITPGTPVPFTSDTRAIRPWRAASSLTGTDIQKLRDAYKAMRALPDDDPRSFTNQAKVHCHYCSETSFIHGKWTFFTWHRAYLYFHERILGELIGDPDLRLPYWDWDRSEGRTLPPAYATPTDVTQNSLFNSSRGMSATDELPEEDVGHDVMLSVLGLDSFSDFGGTATAGGAPEGTPHGAVHVDVGGDMGAFDTAGQDPVFYAHHANIDKLWSDWNAASPLHANPTSAGFVDQTFTFFDEKKAWRSIKASQLVDHQKSLRYSYGLRLILIDWRKYLVRRRIPFPWIGPDPRFKWTAPQVKELLTAVESDSTRVRLVLREVDLPENVSAVYRVYATQDAAQRDAGKVDPAFLGTIATVASSRAAGHKHGPTARGASLLLRRPAVEALAKGESQQLFFVERGKKGTAKPALLRAKQLSVDIVKLQ